MWLHRLALLALGPLALAACSNDPMRYIPSSERSLMQAQARLEGQGPRGDGRISVAELLNRARSERPAPENAAPAARSLTLRYRPGAVQPEAAQREEIARFAAAARGAGLVLVSSRPGGFAAGDAALVGQRRALAVARLLEQEALPVELRFDPAMPPDEVVVAVAAPSGAFEEAGQ